MYEILDLGQNDPRYIAPLNEYAFARILDAGMVAQSGRQNDRRYVPSSRFEPFRAFEEVDLGREQIRAAFAEGIGDLSDDSPAVLVTQMLGGVLEATQCQANSTEYNTHPERVEPARRVQYAIGQIAETNSDFLSVLAQLDDHPDISAPARRLLVQGEITMGCEGLPLSHQYVKETMRYESDYLLPLFQGERWASLIQQVCFCEDVSAIVDVFDAMREATLSEDVVAHTVRSFERTIHSLDDLVWVHRLSGLPELNEGVRQYARSLAGQTSENCAWYFREFHGVTIPGLEMAWQDALGSSYENKIKEYRLKSVEIMDTLERNYPGSLTYLTNRYRIRNFGRYPYEVLERQYLDGQQPQTPARHGESLTNVWYFADYDHSAAFSEGRSTALLSLAKLAWSAGQTFEIHEVDSVDAISGAIRTSNRVIGTAVLSAHSSGQQATLGRRESLRQDEVIDRRWDRCFLEVVGRFAADARVILDSCHTGKSGNLGWTLAETLEVVVDAPTEATALEDIVADPDYPVSDAITPLALVPTYGKLVGEHIYPWSLPR